MSGDELRLKEASNCIQKAKNHLKTCFWKLKTIPEYDLAAYEYARAAICYRNANCLDLCRDMYLEEAKCYTATKNLFHTAKAKENAAMACRDFKDFVKAKELYSESVDDYFASGSINTAVQTLEKAAKMFELILPESAAELYEKGLKFVSQDEFAKTANTFYDRLISIYLKLDKLDDARRICLDLIEKCCEHGNVNKVGNIALGVALIELKIGDSVAALKCLNLIPVSTVSLFSQEISALETLICAYESGDDETFENCLKSSVWKSLNNEFLRLMKTLKVPDDEGYNNSSNNNANVSKFKNNSDEEDVT